MIEKSEIDNNINTHWKIEKKTLKEYKYGLCKFILDKSYELDISKEIAVCAMQIVNYFFIKNCYFNHDKLTIACAALSLSIKLKFSSNNDNLNKIIEIYISNKKEELENNSISLKQQIRNLKKKLLDKEIKIMKLFNYSLPDKFPFEYIYLYSKILYPNNEDEIYNIGNKICVDSYFTYANNIYQNFVISLACIFMAAKFLDIKTFFDKNFKNFDKMKYIHQKDINENIFINRMYQFIDEPEELLINEKDENIEKSKNEYFNNLNLDKKLHPFLEIDDLLECIKMISDFYEEININYNEINKKNK